MKLITRQDLADAYANAEMFTDDERAALCRLGHQPTAKELDELGIYCGGNLKCSVCKRPVELVVRISVDEPLDRGCHECEGAVEVCRGCLLVAAFMAEKAGDDGRR